MQRPNVYLTALNTTAAVGTGVCLVTGSNPFFYGLLFVGNASYAIYYITQHIKEIRHGRNRKAQENSLDPQAYAGTGGAITGQDTTNGTGTAAKGSSLDMPEIETVESDMPILAHRIAYLYFDRKKPFGSLNFDVRFGVDANARCRFRDRSWYVTYPPREKRAPCEAPGLDCECGFYALPSDISPWDEGSNYVTLLVELSGKVIEHETGYRAEHQRVIECQIPPCPFCGDVATSVVVCDGTMTVSACQRHLPPNPKPGAVAVSIDDVAAIVKVPVTCQGTSRETAS